MSDRLTDFFGKIPARVWIYLSVLVAVMLAITLPLALTGYQDVWYSVFWGIFGAVAAVLITRIIYHCATGDNEAEMWAVSLYGIAGDLGWLIGILSTTYTVATIGIVITAAGTLMAAGTRFIGRDGIKVQKSELLGKLRTELRYRFMGDEITGPLDTKRPLVVIEDVRDPLTINEAIAAGYEKEAEEAIEYLKSVINTSVGKEKKE